MNANLSRALALLSVTALSGVLTGCSSSAHPGLTRGEDGPTPQLISREHSTKPDFSTQPTRVQMHDSASRDLAPGLVSLYGELQNDWDDDGGIWDGSSNVSQVTFASEGACSDPDINRDSTWMVFASTQHSTTSDIYLKPVIGRTLTQLTTDPGEDIMPAFHPSGRKIAFASNRAGNWDIYVMSIEGGQPMKVTESMDHELHPSWAPDGSRLVYCKLGSKSGRWEMWVVDTENPGVRRFLDYGLFPQWCPDVARSKILFQRARQRGSRYFSVWTVDFINGEAVHPTEIVSAGNAAVINPSWSPDGSRIVFVTVVEPDTDIDTDSIEQSDVWIINLDGSGRTNLTNGRYANYQPVWSADRRVYFVSNRTGVDNIWAVSTARAMDAITSRSSRITSVDPNYMIEDEPAGRP